MKAPQATRRRSHSPVFWLLFGAGGMLTALFGVALTWIMLWGPASGTGRLSTLLSHERATAVFSQWPVAAFLWMMAALMAWHGAHRMLCSLHDFGVHKGLLAKSIFYGSAAALSVWSAASLWRLI